ILISLSPAIIPSTVANPKGHPLMAKPILKAQLKRKSPATARSAIRATRATTHSPHDSPVRIILFRTPQLICRHPVAAMCRFEQKGFASSLFWDFPGGDGHARLRLAVSRMGCARLHRVHNRAPRAECRGDARAGL